MALEPHYVPAWRELLALYRDQGRVDEALVAEAALETAVEQARAAHADSPYARAILGRGVPAGPGEGS